MVAGPWHTEGCVTYGRRNYWVVWISHPGVYGGRRYLMSPRGSDRKRFYDESKAEAAAAKLNRAAQLDGGQGEVDAAHQRKHAALQELADIAQENDMGYGAPTKATADVEFDESEGGHHD